MPGTLSQKWIDGDFEQSQRWKRPRERAHAPTRPLQVSMAYACFVAVGLTTEAHDRWLLAIDAMPPLLYARARQSKFKLSMQNSVNGGHEKP
jgi:hypothetical protein